MVARPPLKVRIEAHTVFCGDVADRNRPAARMAVADARHQLAQLAHIAGVVACDEELLHCAIDFHLVVLWQ